MVSTSSVWESLLKQGQTVVCAMANAGVTVSKHAVSMQGRELLIWAFWSAMLYATQWWSVQEIQANCRTNNLRCNAMAHSWHIIHVHLRHAWMQELHKSFLVSWIHFPQRGWCQWHVKGQCWLNSQEEMDCWLRNSWPTPLALCHRSHEARLWSILKEKVCDILGNKPFCFFAKSKIRR